MSAADPRSTGFNPPGLFEWIVQQSPELVVLTNPDHEVVWVNAAFTRHTGRTTRQTRGRSLKELLPGLDASPQLDDWLTGRLGQGVAARDIELVWRESPARTWRLRLGIEAFRDTSGQAVAHLCRFSPLEGPSGQVAGFGIAAAKATRLARAPSEGPAVRLRQLARPLKLLIDASEDMQECLQAGSLSALVSGLDQAADALARLREKVNVLQGTPRSVRQEVPRSRIDTAELVHELVDTLMARTGERTIAWTIDPDLPQIEADPALVREVWNKLLANALTRSAYQDVSLIEVGWRAQARGWEFFVHDNGCSFDAQQAGQLFEVLAQPVPSERSAVAGAGRSLALVRRIVEIHGGRVWSFSELGQGASFHFFLPSRGADPTAASNDSQPAPAQSL